MCLVCVCSVVSDSATPWTVRGILQARILEWVAISFSRGSSPPGDSTYISCISCTGRQILYHRSHLEQTLKRKVFIFFNGKLNLYKYIKKLVVLPRK